MKARSGLPKPKARMTETAAAQPGARLRCGYEHGRNYAAKARRGIYAAKSI